MKRRIKNGLGLTTIICCVLYAFFFTLSRKQFYQLTVTYILLFIGLACFWWLFKEFNRSYSQLVDQDKTLFQKHRTTILIGSVGVLLRLMIWEVTPNLSQDFFRFIWDGHMLLNGYNPYLYIPDEIIGEASSFIPNAQVLRAYMGDLSASHYTNYPPLNQFFFAVAAALGGKSITATVIFMRLFIILADVGTLVIMVKLLKQLGKPDYYSLLYFLNPFVLVELTGNLHWEGVMGFFMLLAFYLLLKLKKWWSALFMGYGILLKLMPLLILPILLNRIKFSKIIPYYLFILIVVGIGFLPFLSIELFDKYSNSVGLWFGKFEFNASVYYLVREIGFGLVGYNTIGTIGKILPFCTLISVLLITYFRNNRTPVGLFTSVMFAFCLHLLFSTTVHPWYLVIPLLFSVFTKYRFMVVWSAFIFLSYYAYSNSNYQENLWLIAFEYVVVIGYFIYELFYFSRNRENTTNVNKNVSLYR